MKTLKLLEQLRHCAHGCADGNCPHDRKFRAVLQEAGITLPEKPTIMKTNEPDHSNPNNPGPGWVSLTNDDLRKEGDIFYARSEQRWVRSSYLGRPADPGYWRFQPAPLSPEEQAVIDAMRAGRKVTVEEPPKPPMPRRCWAPFLNAPRCDPWGTAFPLDRDYCGLDEQVQLIELTPEVSAALLAAGIRWEDAPTETRLPEGLSPLPEGVPPLPEGTVYLGEGGTFKTTGWFAGWALDGTLHGSTWQYGSWEGKTVHLHYAAPADSEVVRLNRKQIDPEGSPQRKLLDNPTPTL